MVHRGDGDGAITLSHTSMNIDMPTAYAVGIMSLARINCCINSLYLFQLYLNLGLVFFLSYYMKYIIDLHTFPWKQKKNN